MRVYFSGILCVCDENLILFVFIYLLYIVNFCVENMSELVRLFYDGG